MQTTTETDTPNCPGCLGTGNHSLDCYGGWGPNFETRCANGEHKNSLAIHPACQTIQAAADRWWSACPDHGHQLLPSGSCHECAMLQPEAAETKSDPETEAAVSSALAAFWDQVDHRISGCPVSRDVAMRLEAAAYDAIEAWRAENRCDYCERIAAETGTKHCPIHAAGYWQPA